MHQKWLLRTLALAKQGKGTCSPNPAVGAIVVRNNKEISSGFHSKAGKAHAEVQALRKLDYPLDGATLYISLEPCSHWGKTPPCIEEIVRSGVSKVVFAYDDPNPLVESFNTIKFLKENGIDCLNVVNDEIDSFYESYAYWLKTKLPFVTFKLAQSLNGKIASASGQAVALSGKELNLFTHQYRKQSDVILTTATTIINDNPQLNVRLADEVLKKPLAVIDRKLKVSLKKEQLRCFNAIEIIYHCSKVITDNRFPTKNYVAIKSLKNKLDLFDIIKHLGMQGYHDVWVEAGGELFTEFLRQKLVQRLFLYISPCWLASNSLNSYIDSEDLGLSETVNVEWQQKGQDVVGKFDFK